MQSRRGKRENILRSIEDKDKGKSSSKKKYHHQEENNYHIKLVNIQGLSKTKVVEIECLIKNKGDILCLTETQHKTDKANLSHDITKHIQMRDEKDKKGGGLMVIYQTGCDIDLRKTDTKNTDLLELRGRIKDKDVRILLVYLSIENKPEDKQRNHSLKTELIEKTEECQRQGNEALILLGDFNGHTGYLGEQKLDNNGKFIIDLMTDHSMILLNDDDKCAGTYTWSRDSQKSVIDYILINQKMFNMYTSVHIDEGQEIIDISDHNLLTLNFNINNKTQNYIKHGQWEEREYHRTDKESLRIYKDKLETKIRNRDITITELNTAIRTTADETLKQTYRRRLIKQQCGFQEPPWMNDNIRQQIQRRKELNRKTRGATDPAEKERLHNTYLQQKKRVQHLIKEEMYKHEIKVTNEIKENKESSKLWESINKLKGRKQITTETLVLYGHDGQRLAEEEVGDKLVEHWNKIYQKYDNKIQEVWTQKIREDYTNNHSATCFNIVQEQGNQVYSYQGELREHVDMCFPTNNKITPMEYPTLTTKEVKQCLTKLKNKKACGPDNLKPELYKTLKDSEECLQILTKCFQNIIDNEIKIKEWEQSKTKMIPKTKKPQAGDLRPIALTDISYKLFMSLNGKKIEDHISNNNEIKETQSGFTKGTQIEDNIFILEYCIEHCNTYNKPLIITSIDYSKAFDSIKREHIVKALIHYKIHPKIITTIVNVYTEDSTTIKIGTTETNINIQNGIRQGCTGSTLLFKLITYLIIDELERNGTGFVNYLLNIKALYYADDALLLAHTTAEAEQNLKLLTQISKHYGLEINKKKCNIITYNMQEQPHEIEGIKVSEKLKYLGLIIDNKRNYFKTQKEEMMKKAQKLANVTYSVIAKSCNKILIGKTFWKSVAIPSILHGVNMINMTETDIEKLQRIENGVYRQILCGPKYAARTTLRGEIGASLMKRRIIDGRIQYYRKITTGNNDLLKIILEQTKEGTCSTWMKNTNKYFEEINITHNDITQKTKEELKETTRIWDTNKWREEMENKSSLSIYRHWKKDIKEAECYDNRPSSTIMYKARANCLPLHDRKRHTNEDTSCKVCSAENETLEHFLLWCPAYQEKRKECIDLQQPYRENVCSIIGAFLFRENDIENKKEIIYDMWKIRDRHLRN